MCKPLKNPRRGDHDYGARAQTLAFGCDGDNDHWHGDEGDGDGNPQQQWCKTLGLGVMAKVRAKQTSGLGCDDDDEDVEFSTYARRAILSTLLLKVWEAKKGAISFICISISQFFYLPLLEAVIYKWPLLKF